MSWAKRNLFFLIGAGIALLLLGLAGFYLYSGWTQNNANYDKLDKDYSDWKRIIALNPNPGNEKVDNIKLAVEYRDQVRGVIGNARKSFAPVPPIPPSPRVSKDEFASGLRRTVDQLQHDAANASVTLPTKYQFSFEAQKSLPNFFPGSLPLLSVQLGEVKTICDILFRAKINSLDSLRREKVSTDDDQGPASDYLGPSITAVTNDLAVLAPYEITFKCFGAELARVLSGFANEPHGFIVKSVNVEPAAAPTSTAISPEAATTAMSASAAYAAYVAATQGAMIPPTAAAAPAPGRGVLVTVLDEKPLKVVMLVNVVRLQPRR